MKKGRNNYAMCWVYQRYYSAIASIFHLVRTIFFLSWRIHSAANLFGQFVINFIETTRTKREKEVSDCSGEKYRSHGNRTAACDIIELRNSLKLTSWKKKTILFCSPLAYQLLRFFVVFIFDWTEFSSIVFSPLQFALSHSSFCRFSFFVACVLYFYFSISSMVRKI